MEDWLCDDPPHPATREIATPIADARPREDSVISFLVSD
jgi:hypothetical protein